MHCIFSGLLLSVVLYLSQVVATLVQKADLIVSRPLNYFNPMVDEKQATIFPKALKFKEGIQAHFEE